MQYRLASVADAAVLESRKVVIYSLVIDADAALLESLKVSL